MGTCKMLITLFLCLDGGIGGIAPFSCFVFIDFSILI